MIDTECGSITIDNGTVILDAYMDLVSGGMCNMSGLGYYLPIFVNGASALWNENALTSDTVHPSINAIVNDPIQPIQLPPVTSIVQIGNYPSNIIYTAVPELPDGLSMKRGVIQGTPTTLGTYTFTIQAVDVFSKLSTPIGNYTILVNSLNQSVVLSTSGKAVIIVCIVLIIFILLLVLYIVRQRNRSRIPFDFREMVKNNMQYKNDDYGIPKEIKRDYVTITSVLGKGNFGEVSKGTVTSSGDSEVVAIKVLHQSADAASARLQLLEEAAVMAQFDHPHVVKLIGVVTSGNPLLVVM